MNRCTGHCCRSFYLSEGESYDQIQDEYRRWQENPSRDPNDEIQIIAPMLVPKGKDSKGNPLFTCNNLKNGKDCGIYATRPDMCREVGETIPCLHPYCRMKERTFLQKVFLFLTEREIRP